MLVAFAGLPGSGKSTLAKELATELSAIILDKDRIRAALFPPSEVEYSTSQDDLCVSVMLQVAGYIFQKDPKKIIFLDGRPFTKEYQIQVLSDFCQKRSYSLRIIECVCSPESAQKRLSLAPVLIGHPAKNRNYDLYSKMKSSAEPIRLPHLTVNTDDRLEVCLELIRSYLLNGQ